MNTEKHSQLVFVQDRASDILVIAISLVMVYFFLDMKTTDLGTYIIILLTYAKVSTLRSKQDNE